MWRNVPKVIQQGWNEQTTDSTLLYSPPVLRGLTREALETVKPWASPPEMLAKWPWGGVWGGDFSLPVVSTCSWAEAPWAQPGEAQASLTCVNPTPAPSSLLVESPRSSVTLPSPTHRQPDFTGLGRVLPGDTDVPQWFRAFP